MNFLLIPLQTGAVVFLLFAFSRVWLRAKEGSIGWGMFLFWTAIWLLAILAVIRPEFTTAVANELGVGRGVDAVVYTSIVILFYLNFRSNVLIENLRHEITKLTREIALKNQK
jgi:hypothetical protein